jgi:GTP-binding protein YchF
MQIGIIGYPNVGKSTLFNALTGAGAPVANYPFTTVDKNVGIVPIPDKRLEKLDSILHPEKLTPATVKFVDIAGLVKGASKGEGLGNRFLAHIREVDCLLHLARAFKDPELIHVHGHVEPIADIGAVNLELCLADLDTVDRRIEKIRKKTEAKEELSFIGDVRNSLERGERPVFRDDKERGYLSSYNLLTLKPCIYVLNMDEEDLTEGNFEEMQRVKESLGDAKVLPISAKSEYELSLLEIPERALMRRELGLQRFSLDTIIEESYNMLNLIRFYTIKGEETRAWTLPRGSKVLEAAHKVHTDMAEKFIKAEVFPFDEIAKCESTQILRDKGLMKVEGKDYVVKDGDVILIKFGV